MTEVCDIGSLAEDLTGTPAAGISIGPLVLRPLVVGAIVLQAPTPDA